MCDIRPIGSEIFVKQWENKIGVAFSSPPYFCLEDYKVGLQSYTQGETYDDWKNNYLKKTFENIYLYLVKEGYFILNIKNFDKYKLVDDSIKIAEEVGFELYCEHKLINIKRIKSNKDNLGNNLNDNSEKILVFIKK